jgi:protein-tyrosine phosphatase
MHAKMMRRVALPTAIKGQLWLGPMPGRLYSLNDCLAAYRDHDIARIVCLAPVDEIRAKAPDYSALLDAEMPVAVSHLPIADFGVPQNEDMLWATTHRAADALLTGKNLFVHCAAGIGRTGMVATCILMAAGIESASALTMIRQTGSGPETEEQSALLERFAAALKASLHCEASRAGIEVDPPRSTEEIRSW